MRQVVDTILPTTMVGSYPRPKWFNYQLLGRDVRVAFKHVDHAEAYEDATATSIRDQEAAGLDIVTDGQMYFDDYVGVIGSFCWYMYERIGGFEPAKEEHQYELACWCPGCRRWAACDLRTLVRQGLGDRAIQACRPRCRKCGSVGVWSRTRQRMKLRTSSRPELASRVVPIRRERPKL